MFINIISKVIEYTKVNHQYGHILGSALGIIGWSYLVHAIGNNQPVLMGCIITLVWYYSRAFVEHQMQDDPQPWYKSWCIFYWDNWRASKFVFALVVALPSLLHEFFGVMK